MNRFDLIEAAAKVESYAVDLTRELIRIPTVNPPGREYGRCANFLANELRRLGAEVDLVAVPAERLDELAPHGENCPSTFWESQGTVTARSFISTISMMPFRQKTGR
jgi:acetylornithine deacetylase/succinyl-diaminopimelate desuccinylase-like protein